MSHGTYRVERERVKVLVSHKVIKYGWSDNLLLIYLPGLEGPELHGVLNQVPVGAVAQEREQASTAHTENVLFLFLTRFQ